MRLVWLALLVGVVATFAAAAARIGVNLLGAEFALVSPVDWVGAVAGQVAGFGVVWLLAVRE